MSSIRPLATITVLAVVGVILSMKINETEPPLPEGVTDWAATTELDLDIGGDIGGGNAIPTPQFGVTSPESEAPAFAVATTLPAPAVGVPVDGGVAAGDVAPAFGAGVSSADATAAPAWSDSPTNNATPTVAVAGIPTLNQKTVEPKINNEMLGIGGRSNDVSEATPQLPDLPAMPSMPSATSAEPSAAGAVQTNLPDMPQDLSLPADSQSSLPPIASSDSGIGTPPVAPPLMTPDVPPASALAAPPTSSVAQAQSSLFSATRLAVHAALDRGELSQALLLLSDWYGDPSLTPGETSEVNSLLGQLAGSVIYSTEHRLEPPYMVQAGERLETIAKKYDVPWQLLAKINGITSADQLQPGQQLKVLRGPFSAQIDISQRKMTLMLDRRYAGRFTLNLDPSVTVEEGHWEVNQKLLTPSNVSLPGAGPTTSNEERSLLLSSTDGGASQVAILRGAMTTSATDPAGRVLKLNPADATDVFDILSLGSKVVIRR